MCMTTSVSSSLQSRLSIKAFIATFKRLSKFLNQDNYQLKMDVNMNCIELFEKLVPEHWDHSLNSSFALLLEELLYQVLLFNVRKLQTSPTYKPEELKTLFSHLFQHLENGTPKKSRLLSYISYSAQLAAKEAYNHILSVIGKGPKAFSVELNDIFDSMKTLHSTEKFHSFLRLYFQPVLDSYPMSVLEKVYSETPNLLSTQPPPSVPKEMQIPHRTFAFDKPEIYHKENKKKQESDEDTASQILEDSPSAVLSQFLGDYHSNLHGSTTETPTNKPPQPKPLQKQSPPKVFPSQSLSQRPSPSPSPSQRPASSQSQIPSPSIPSQSSHPSNTPQSLPDHGYQSLNYSPLPPDEQEIPPPSPPLKKKAKVQKSEECDSRSVSPMIQKKEKSRSRSKSSSSSESRGRNKIKSKSSSSSSSRSSSSSSSKPKKNEKKDKKVSPKDKKTSPKDKKVSPKDKNTSPKVKKVSPKDKNTSPKVKKSKEPSASSESEDEKRSASKFNYDFEEKRYKPKKTKTDKEDDSSVSSPEQQPTSKLTKKRKLMTSTTSTKKLKTSTGERLTWTEHEVKQLEKGVAVYGVGHWAEILKAYKFLPERTSVSLKDKWRNLSKKQRSQTKFKPFL
eukprot:TRINITY_DN4947_c0_g1_i1.p1 TRINITY_DN4947_c0_g1~~TRINITY_DN4947_c0_g1_i1.p1  ORF type:complete len:653 (-),score=173.57 TRINITY_DN4947_c0_g1_i1:9-1865(-)